MAVQIESPASDQQLMEDMRAIDALLDRIEGRQQAFDETYRQIDRKLDEAIERAEQALAYSRAAREQNQGG